jgi:polysaccharide chain length determinant protein (PEP-CTERM system associated)
LAFTAVAFGSLTVGAFWSEKYETSTLLYADVTNIIEPLLKGRAEMTGMDRSQEARELIYTRRILLKVAESVGLMDGGQNVTQQEAIINGLRSNIEINNEGKNFFKISYVNESQETSFKVLNAVVDAFIRDTSESKRNESRNAFEFIDQQVASYKRQLVEAENRLKQFKAANLDGTAQAVAGRVERLRNDIEESKLDIDESAAKYASLQKQLKSEAKYQVARSELEAHMNKLERLNKALDELRLSYQDSYPDIVELKDQIAALELVIEASKEEGSFGSYSMENIENPLYEELRKRQSEAELELQSQKKRKLAMERMLKDEYARAERIAQREAELAELVRDYDVTRGIYEEMLERKEKARLSMTLDIEGQGVSYKIQEPAVFPLHPSGLRFIHFALLGPVIGLIAGVGIVIAYVLLDPRVRAPTQLVMSMPQDVELLAVIPHINTPLSKRLFYSDLVMLGLAFLAVAGAYTGIIYMVLKGGL